MKPQNLRSLTNRDDCKKYGLIMRKSGFTLLEVLVALAILALGIVGVLRALSGSLNATKEAELNSKASILANQVASQLDRESDVSSGEVSGTFEDESGYNWIATIEPADNNGLMRTKIVVSWGSDANPKHFDMIICLHPSSNSTTTSTSTTTEGK